MSQNLGTLAITSGQPTVFSSAPPMGARAVVIGNESGLTCTITMEGGNVQKTLYPGTVDWFTIKPGFTGTIRVSPTAILNNSSSWPASSLVFDAIGINDEEQAYMYPISLVRNTNIGNSVSTSVTSTNAISNTTNAPGSNWLTVTPNDAASPTFSGDTSGNLTVKGDNAGTLTTLLQLIAGASPAVKIAAAAIIAEVLGGLKVDGTFESAGAATFDSTLAATGTITANGGVNVGTIRDNSTGATQATLATAGITFPNITTHTGGIQLGSGATGDFIESGETGNPKIVDCTSGTNLFLNPPATGTGHKISFDTNATERIKVDDTGLVLVNGKISLLAGTLTRFTGFSGTGSGTVNTNLGATPNQIAFNPCTVSGSSQTIGGTVAQSTVVTTGAGLAFGGIAFKDV